MILSRYSNPPYRSPKMNSASPPQQAKQLQQQPPPSSQSPKRKRADSTPSATIPPAAAPALLQIETSDLSDAEASGGGANSPRTKVAERLRGLDLRQNHQHRDSETPQVKRQKLKRRFEMNAKGEEGMEMEMEIGETPQTQATSNDPTADGISSSPMFSSSFMQELRQAAEEDPARSPSSASSKRLTSPPPPAPMPTASSFNSTTSTASTASLDLSDSDPTALTWQDSEITGQEIDTSTPDDDGEGINGIGFKPTPAMAQARSLKRRQQVNEWKAREAREARQKRLDRRRKGSGSGGESRADGEAKRSVRFAGFS